MLKTYNSIRNQLKNDLHKYRTYYLLVYFSETLDISRESSEYTLLLYLFQYTSYVFEFCFK